MSDEPFEPLVPGHRGVNAVYHSINRCTRGVGGVPGFFDLRPSAEGCEQMVVVFDEGDDDG